MGFKANFEALTHFKNKQSVQIIYHGEGDAVKKTEIDDSKAQSKNPGEKSFQRTRCMILGDLRDYKTLTFLIKGKRGGETFDVGIEYRISEDRKFKVKTGSIYRYLPSGITTEWQVVKIPLDDFFDADLGKTESLMFYFNEPGSGTFWIDEILF